MKMTESMKHSQSMRENIFDSQSPKRNTQLRKQPDSRLRYTQNRRQLTYQFSPQTHDNQRQYENHDNQKTANDGLKKDTTLYNEQEMKIHKKVIEDMWDYRYWRLVDRTIKSKDWMPVFAFLGQFKLKCLEVAKLLFNEKFSRKQIDKIDHRYDMKGDSELLYRDNFQIRKNKKQLKELKEFAPVVHLHKHQQQPSQIPLTCLAKYEVNIFVSVSQIRNYDSFKKRYRIQSAKEISQ